MDALVAVRDRLARAIIGALPEVPASLGTVELRLHQQEAVRRLLRTLHTHGGALLADAPGLGKTYVALAVARTLGGALVVGPASLKHQWQRSAVAGGVSISWCSLETLSRRSVATDTPLIIVDEAHHLRNPRTQRYARAAALTMGRRVLLLSATPVHNTAADQRALLALFLGASAALPSPGVVAELTVRRESVADAMPTRRRTRWLDSPPSPAIARALRRLPPPIPAADGRAALALLRMTLAHAWSSSLAALDAALRRSVQRTLALDDALATGRWPTRRELRAWSADGDASQLAFPEVVASPASGDLSTSRRVLAEHLRAVRDLRNESRSRTDDDAHQRAILLRRIMRRHPGEIIVAFSRYAATVDALWRQLRFEAGVAAITASGVRSAGGGLTRRDVLDRLGANSAPDARLPLRLVLSTDLLGEGLNLRAASVIVHLDQAWTPARMDQREGRAVRLDASHAAVTIYAVRPPGAAARFLRIGRRLRHKRSAMEDALEPGAAREFVLALVRPWVQRRSGPSRRAAVAATQDGWVAAVRDATGRVRILTSNGVAIGEDEAQLAMVLSRIASAQERPVDPGRLRATMKALRAWLEADATATLANAHGPPDAMRVALARRLDNALQSAALHERAALHARIAAVRPQLLRARGAGVERALAAAARQADAEALLDAIERCCANFNAEGPALRGSRVLALLLLTTDGDGALSSQ
ncbi:MAG: hypothetical protein FJ363_12795 [Gemmatimonadetes bacterium]|nr:hypothetical protein [Gemmatimonadota bacterium]